MLKKSLIILSATIMLNGCAVVAIGGAGTAGYYTGKDERDFSAIMSDAGITTSINTKLLVAKGVSTFDINIDTHNGIVTASGNAPSKKIKLKILQLCQQAEGVKKVISKIKIEK